MPGEVGGAIAFGSPRLSFRGLPGPGKSGTLCCKVTSFRERPLSDERSWPIRAVLRNALTWGAAWAAVGGAITFLLGLFTSNPAVESLPERLGLAVAGGIAWGVRFGVAGAVIGTLFSTAIRLAWRGRRIADIHPLRFALLGAVVGGAGVPLYLQIMNILSGSGPLPGDLVLTDAVLGVVLGAAVAGGSILLARRADPLAAGSEQGRIGGPRRSDGLAAGARRESPLLEREDRVHR